MSKTFTKTEQKYDHFCREYLIDRNGTRSAISAGYSEKTAAQAACRLLKNVKITNMLIDLTQERNERLDINADYVLSQAVKLHERCMQEVDPVTVKGTPIKDEEGRTVYKFDSMGAAKALDMVGKHIDVQAFKEQIGVTADQTMTPWSSIESGVDE